MNLNAMCLFFLTVVTSNCSIALKSTLKYLRSFQYLLYMILKKIKERRVIFLLRSPLSYMYLCYCFIKKYTACKKVHRGSSSDQIMSSQKGFSDDLITYQTNSYPNELFSHCYITYIYV